MGERIRGKSRLGVNTSRRPTGFPITITARDFDVAVSRLGRLSEGKLRQGIGAF